MVNYTRNSVRKSVLISWLAISGVLFFINIISGFFYKRIDLTADKRFTLNPASETLLEGLPDVATVTVYLQGKDLPPNFEQLRIATEDLLEEFKGVAGDKLEYRFVDPFADVPSDKARKDLFTQLRSQGLREFNVGEQSLEEGANTERVLIPGALVTLNGKTLAVPFIEETAVDPDFAINSAANGLEFGFANAIQKLSKPEVPKIAFIRGHGELEAVETADLYQTLKRYYEVDYVNLPEYKVGRLDPYKLAIIAKPDSSFSELEKYKLDQYIMGGGRVIWLIDGVRAELDSLFSGDGITYTNDYDLNILEDMLFGYGVRVNYNLVQDLNSHVIPVVRQAYGGSQRQDLARWPYYPLVNGNKRHPIVSGLAPVWLQFASTIDTIYSRRNPKLKKSVLLQTGPESRVLKNPVALSLGLIENLGREAPMFRAGPQTVAVLLEGPLLSNFFDRRPTDATLASGDYGAFKEKTDDAKMIVVSDGDIARNNVSRRSGPQPLGFDFYSRLTFANKTFLLNSVDYLLDNGGLSVLRNKDVKLRMLSKAKVADKSLRSKWQAINVALPLLLLLVFGLLYNYVRKRRFAV